MFVVLIGVVGLAVDGGVAYAYSVSIERAAAAAALAGVPYLPQNYNTGSPNAQTRARDEAKRNGFDTTNPSCNCTIAFGLANNNQNLDVTITQTVPTFFMQTLGLPRFDIKRTAEAGFRPAIKLGSPDNQFGSSVSEIGSAGHFYVLRHKAWHVGGGRAEGDGFTVDPSYDSPGSTSTDVHAISGHQGNETTDTNFTGTFPIGWDDRGGENYRIVIPEGTPGGEIQVYNAAFGPDKGNARQNPCENWQNPTVANGKCNPDPNQNLHEDDGKQARCSSPGCSGQQGEYNTVLYTLFQINDASVRSNDKVLMQTKIYPLDASAYNAGPSPQYINAHDGTTITQSYDPTSLPLAGRPLNMRAYHSWTNIANEAGGPDAASRSLFQRTGYWPPVTGSGTRIQCTFSCPDLPPGAYRLRVDFLDANGKFVNGGSSNHAYAIRVVKPLTQPEQPSNANVCSGTVGAPPVTTNCTVSGWEDAVVYTPLTQTGNNFIPLFELPKDYAGSTIDIDLYDMGDVVNNNTVSIIDPTKNPGCTPFPACGLPADEPALQLTDNGINRGGSPAVQHVCGPNSQCPDGIAPPFNVPNLNTSTEATWDASVGGDHRYNGTWIRVTIPVPGTYSPGANGAFWYVRYNIDRPATDTFSFGVSVRGGPVHLLKS